jgi:hypothetical protein
VYLLSRESGAAPGAAIFDGIGYMQTIPTQATAVTVLTINGVRGIVGLIGREI